MSHNKRVFFFIGTEAELIKLFPVILSLQDKGIDYVIISSGQNNIENSPIFINFKIKTPGFFLSKFVEKKNPYELFSWFFKTLFRSLLSLRARVKKGDVLIVHGDTVSTVMGALLGKYFKMTVMHVEAGLRSFDNLNPFPEEIDRVIVSNLADYHFCPNAWAKENIKSKDNVIDTHMNTLYESLHFALTIQPDSKIISLASLDYGIVSVHRQENIYNHRFMRDIIAQIVLLSAQTKILFIVYAQTKQVLESMGLYQLLASNNNVQLTPRMPYVDLMHLLKTADFIVTDGGSNQEECYYLGLPCLVLRKKTERVEGLNNNVVLMDDGGDSLNHFLKNRQKFRTEPVVAGDKPSEIITKAIVTLIRKNNDKTRFS